MSFPTRRPAQAPAQNARGGRHEKTLIGKFHLAHAMINGIIVKEGPVKRYSQRGTPWTTATLLVDLYDSRQKKERERPAFVRLVAFHAQAEALDGFEKHQRVHAAGRLIINTYEDREGKVREGYELQANHLSREPFPTLEDLMGPNEPAAAQAPQEASASETSTTDEGPPTAAGDEPWRDAGAQLDSENCDDIPF